MLLVCIASAASGLAVFSLTDVIVADGAAQFFILSAATAVAATTCACLPVILPIACKAHKRRREGTKPQPSPLSAPPSFPSGSESAARKGRGFTRLDGDSSDRNAVELGEVETGGGDDRPEEPVRQMRCEGDEVSR